MSDKTYLTGTNFTTNPEEIAWLKRQRDLMKQDDIRVVKEIITSTVEREDDRVAGRKSVGERGLGSGRAEGE